MTHTKDTALKQALEALEEIALAGMSGTGQESKEAMTAWHARQAWKFIGIAARALEPIKQALAVPTVQKRPQNCGTGYCSCIECVMEPAPVQEPALKPLSKKWRWVLHESFADVAGFDEEGIPSFYWKESVTKFKSGELSAPCKGKNCGSLNGWLHSSECRAEHEAQYTTPPAQPAPVQGWRADVQKVRDSLEPEDWCGDEKMIDVLDRVLAQKPCCLNMAAGTSCLSDPKANCPLLATAPAQPAVQETVGWKWHQAPVKTSWGHEMVVADLAIDKDNTVSVYCERDQTAKVEAMLNPPAQPAVPDAITDNSENPKYRAGWNECRETMLEMMKARTL
jgi:hypothetical protein